MLDSVIMTEQKWKEWGSTILADINVLKKEASSLQ